MAKSTIERTPKTTRIYATPSMEMLKVAMMNDNVDSPEMEEWLDDEEYLARIGGLR